MGKLRGMLHVGEVSFFKYTYLSPWAENWKFPAWGEIDILTFLDDILYVFVLQKYRYSDVITDKRSVISDTINDKLEKNKIVVLIDTLQANCCKFISALQLYGTLRGNWKIKGNTEIYLLPFIS